MGRPLIPLTITGEEEEQLLAWSKRPKTAQAWRCARVWYYWPPMATAIRRLHASCR